jgi:hypothetical protein
MTRRLSLAKADQRMGKLRRQLRNNAEPRDQVLEVLYITAFYRGVIDNLMTGKEPGWKERVSK